MRRLNFIAICALLASTMFGQTSTPNECIAALKNASSSLEKRVQQGGVEVSMKLHTIATQEMGGVQDLNATYLAMNHGSQLTTDHFIQFEDTLSRIIVMKASKTIYIYDQLQEMKKQALWRQQFFNEQLYDQARISECNTDNNGIMRIKLEVPDDVILGNVASALFILNTATNELVSTLIRYRKGHQITSYEVSYESYKPIIQKSTATPAINQILNNGELREAYSDFEIVDHRNG